MRRAVTGRQGLRSAYLNLARDMRAMGHTYVEIAEVFRERHGFGALTAMRMAHGWSQSDVARQWNERWPGDAKNFKTISYWENWRNGGHKPDLATLDRLALIYQCRVADLVMDCGDYRPAPMEEARNAVEDMLASDAFARAELLEREVSARWPDAWKQLDEFRRHPPGPWPYWCLMPSTLAATVAGWSGDGPTPAHAIACLYAWRYARSVYVFEPSLLSRLSREVPDDLVDVDPGRLLPEWCVYIAGSHPEWPGSGLWAYVDYDYALGRPELRLLIDLADGGLDSMLAIPIRLDRPLTEGLAEHRGGEPDGTIAQLANVLDRLLSLITYLTRPSSDLVAQGPSDRVRPSRARDLCHERTVWAVGYSSK